MHRFQAPVALQFRTNSFGLTSVSKLAKLSALFCVLLMASSAGGQDSAPKFPYQALVSAEETTVHSGPAKVHYGTSVLQQGDSVEVYRIDPGGWCAVRPPSGSFSLLPESTVKMVREGVAEVLVDHARVWVGTRLGPVEKPLWQVKLRQGELISVIGETSFPDPSGFSTVWYQIEPPPGEFRWIHQNDLKSLNSDLPQPATDVASPLPRMRSPKVIPASVIEPLHQEDLVQHRPTHLSRPEPDEATRSNRVIGSGLRQELVDSQFRARPANPQRPSPARNQSRGVLPHSNHLVSHEARSAFQNASNVITADYHAETANNENENPIRYDANVAQASNDQELVRPQNRDGINQGWRPSQRAGSRKTDLATGAPMMPSGLSYAQQANQQKSEASQTLPSGFRRNEKIAPWSPIAQNQNLANNALPPFNPPSNPTVDRSPRFADAAFSRNRFAEQLDLAQQTAVQGSYQGDLGDLKTLEAALTREMLKTDPSTWQLDDLVLQIRKLQQLRLSSSDQTNLNRLLTKVQQCQRLNAMYTRGPESPAGTFASNPTGNSNEPNHSAFDATGWLKELKRQQGLGQSTYVLQDDSGKVTHHLQPVPGVNLTRYLKQKVGVIGRRGYHQELQLDHVEVSRVFGL